MSVSIGSDRSCGPDTTTPRSYTEVCLPFGDKALPDLKTASKVFL